ncbi:MULTISPECIES: hypothetical protein [Bradyrhizobium]|uniref:hypothetical protein n=1 Tax=Bradyrhizobium TaxID=374 RepID=UPI001CA5E86F|nr:MULTISPECIES: hypothetical protein [Bradyrhizobium]MCS3764794.1 hypothetical protein [Bradyrhizobium centrosematis]MCS3776154.1 hypothetical protein [Bradyrhizobium centrosematis]
MLGARHLLMDNQGNGVKGAARHLFGEDDVVIYARANIPVGSIGRGSSTGNNVWLT